MSLKGVVYNEIDPFCVEWLRRLILADLIAPGDVDDRSILDVSPDDWRGYAQVHAFAGIGVWSYALRAAGWPDDRPVWTGSCPCQPFSQAGGRGGFADERHLWPSWHWLIDKCRPDVVLGEQVASADGLAWFDLVSTDLEGSGYACGATDQCVAGFGGPHIRQRLWFVGVRDAGSIGLRRGHEYRADLRAPPEVPPEIREQRFWPDNRADSAIGRLSDFPGGGRQRVRAEPAHGLPLQNGATSNALGRLSDDNAAGRKVEREVGLRRPELYDSDRCRATGWSPNNNNNAGLALGSLDADGRRPLRFEGSAFGEDEPVRGFWSGADWLWYRDGKYRPVEAGTFPLAPSAPGRVGRLRAYGNSVNAEVCKGFIEAVMSLCP